MNKHDLFEAMGGIDDDLLARSEQRPARKLPLRKALIAAAAVMLLAATAVATPGIRDWIASFQSEQTRDGGLREYGDGTLGYSEATYKVTLEVENAEDAPEGIKEYRMPAYFAENNWTITPLILYPDDPYMSAVFSYYSPGDAAQWVLFEQNWLYSTSSGDTTKSYKYYIPAGLYGEIEEHPVTIGDWDATLYITPPSEIEDAVSLSGQQTVIWSDGTYAYCLECSYNMPYEMIEKIILSLAPVDVSVYGTVDPDDNSLRKPIEEFYTLSKVPEDFGLWMRSWDVNNAGEFWENEDRDVIHIGQSVPLSGENDGPALSIEDTLYDLEYSRVDFTKEEIVVDGLDVTIVRMEDSILVMWYTEDYGFSIEFRGSFDLTTDELAEYVRSVVPMEDFTDHLTE